MTIQTQRRLTKKFCLKELELKELDFERLQALNKILAPFWTLTNQLSSRTESISSVLPAYFALKSHLQNDPITLKSTICDGLENRMSPFLNEG
jgi:hypothetical protein